MAYDLYRKTYGRRQGMEQKHAEPGKRVIVVEDDSTMLLFWGRILKDLGITNFELFSNPLEAKLILEKVPYNLLISGIVMPHALGYDLAKIARRQNPACAIVLTTGFRTDLSRFNLANCRFHLLHKPYSDLAAVKNLITHLYNGEDSFDDLSEESSSENEDYPEVIEWKL